MKKREADKLTELGNMMSGDLSISGSGTAPGGTYRTVSISGSGKVQGDISCESMEISGSGKILGNTDAKSLRINGSGVINGSIKAAAFTVNGSSRIEKSITAREFLVNGKAKIGGSLHGETTRSYGILNVGGDIETEVLTVEGQLSVDGLCSAEQIHLKLIGGSSMIREIGCSKLEVRRKAFAGLLSELFGTLRKTCLSVDTIEGDEIFIEDTAAKTVRGNRVVIGEGCHIDQIFYKQSYQCAERSKVAAAFKE
jgi:Integral membrane protein CcmA involved in cell shape determination